MQTPVEANVSQQKIAESQTKPNLSNVDIVLNVEKFEGSSNLHNLFGRNIETFGTKKSTKPNITHINSSRSVDSAEEQNLEVNQAPILTL